MFEQAHLVWGDSERPLPRQLRHQSAVVVPRLTTFPFDALTGRGVIVADDENVRLSALEHDRRPDYERLAALAARRFSTVEVRVFAVRPVERRGATLPPNASVYVHRRKMPGKNSDMDAALWFARAVDARAFDAVLFATGDHDYLACAEDARSHGVTAAFISPPGRSLSRWIAGQRSGLLGADVLVRNRYPLASWDGP